MPDPFVLEIQRLYPQIYLACHVDHVRAKSTPFRLSAADSSILAHLSPERPIEPRELARHLGVRRSTLSAAIARLAKLGYLSRTIHSEDRRRVELLLTPKGAEAMAATSVLDANRVAEVLTRLTKSERRRAVAGLALLARGSREQTSSRR